MSGAASSPSGTPAGPTPARNGVGFGTFTGVFTPTLLTILGVIMYVRIGWVVGNAGLGGAWVIMGLAMTITACTGLSLSSIATNTRIGVGGPYAIMSRSLGFEVGGAIGIPLYLTRPLGVAMYIIGFREGWLWIFPDHPPLAVDVAVLGLLFIIAWISANLAFKTQYAIMAVIAVSLLAVFLSPLTIEPTHEIVWWGDYPGFAETGFGGTDFWMVFAVFFPATTGILAGANMSGDLTDPRRAIPVGTLAAIALSSLIYFAVAWWIARTGTTTELATNYNHLIDKALFGPAVLAGLLGATFSSALAGLVGGPRILMAMGQHQLVPGSNWLAKTSDDGEPRNSLLLTGALTLLCVMVRDLNTIAPLVTMFFLITYCTLNVVVLLEGGLGLVSFRPTLKVPLIVPALGLIGCLFAMFIVNPTFGLVAITVVMAIYLWIQRRGVATASEDVRSSVFVAVAEWAASKVTERDLSNVRAWKPNLLVPVADSERARGKYHLLLHLARPEGSIKLLGLDPEESESFRNRLQDLGRSFRGDGVQCSWSNIPLPGFVNGVGVGLMALQAAFWRPNLLVLNVPESEEGMDELRALSEIAHGHDVGVLLVALHRHAGLGRRERVNLWVRPHHATWDPDAAFDAGNLNLILLMGIRLMRTWNADLHLITTVRDEADAPEAREFLRRISELARLPSKVVREAMVGTFEECMVRATSSDLTILGIAPQPDHERLQTLVELSRSSCVFVRDSGRESARA